MKYLLFILLVLIVGAMLFMGRGQPRVEGVVAKGSDTREDDASFTSQELVEVQDVVRVRRSGLEEEKSAPVAILDKSNSIEVIVMGPGGARQAGYPVRLCFAVGDDKFVRAGPLRTHLALSDGKGIARFSLEAVEGLEGKGFLLSGLQWEQKVFVRLTPGRIASGRILFHAPGGGGLAVLLEDKDGERWSGGETVYAEGASWRRHSFLAADGWYYLYGLPSGEAFQFVVVDRGQDVGVSQACKPLWEGEGLRRIKLQRSQVEFSVRASIVKADGGLLREGRVMFEAEGVAPFAMQTDAEGELEWTLPRQNVGWIKIHLPSNHASNLSLRQFEKTFWSGSRSGRVHQGAWSKLPPLKPGVLMDQGAIHLGRDPVLIAGRVRIRGSSQGVWGEVQVFETGAPMLAGVSFVQVLSKEPIAKGVIQYKNAPPGLAKDPSPVEPTTIAVPTASDPEGSFRIPGIYGPQSVRLEVKAWGARFGERYVASSHLEVEVGSRDLEIELVLAAQLRGHINSKSMQALSESVRLAGLRVVIRYSDGYEEDIPVDSEGRFSRDLLPGLVDIRVSSKGGISPLAGILGVELLTGDEQDPRLYDIVLD